MDRARSWRRLSAVAAPASLREGYTADIASAAPARGCCHHPWTWRWLGAAVASAVVPDHTGCPGTSGFAAQVQGTFLCLDDSSPILNCGARRRPPPRPTSSRWSSRLAALAGRGPLLVEPEAGRRDPQGRDRQARSRLGSLSAERIRPRTATSAIVNKLLHAPTVQIRMARNGL